VAVASDGPAIHVTIDATALMKVGIGAGYICPIVSTGIARSLARNDIPFVSPVDLRIHIAFNPNPCPILSPFARSGPPRERHASQ
jgi:hypothetical protein